MNILLNGQETKLTDNIHTLSDLVTHYDLSPKLIVIEHNKNIISKDHLSQIELSENDCVEIVQFVGGGALSNGNHIEQVNPLSASESMVINPS